MADKEATVYIVDVGKSTAQKHGGRSKTDLEWALTYVWDRVTGVVRAAVHYPGSSSAYSTQIALERKTTLQAVVAVRTNGTFTPIHIVRKS
jgi:ATP-dependent DNA helicase 2 subunit 2